MVRLRRFAFASQASPRPRHVRESIQSSLEHVSAPESTLEIPGSKSASHPNSLRYDIGLHKYATPAFFLESADDIRHPRVGVKLYTDGDIGDSAVRLSTRLMKIAKQNRPAIRPHSIASAIHFLCATALHSLQLSSQSRDAHTQLLSPQQLNSLCSAVRPSYWLPGSWRRMNAICHIARYDETTESLSRPFLILQSYDIYLNPQCTIGHRYKMMKMMWSIGSHVRPDFMSARSAATKAPDGAAANEPLQSLADFVLQELHRAVYQRAFPSLGALMSTIRRTLLSAIQSLQLTSWLEPVYLFHEYVLDDSARRTEYVLLNEDGTAKQPKTGHDAPSQTIQALPVREEIRRTDLCSKAALPEEHARTRANEARVAPRKFQLSHGLTTRFKVKNTLKVKTFGTICGTDEQETLAKRIVEQLEQICLESQQPDLATLIKALAQVNLPPRALLKLAIQGHTRPELRRIQRNGSNYIGISFVQPLLAKCNITDQNNITIEQRVQVTPGIGFDTEYVPAESSLFMKSSVVDEATLLHATYLVIVHRVLSNMTFSDVENVASALAEAVIKVLQHKFKALRIESVVITARIRGEPPTPRAFSEPVTMRASLKESTKGEAPDGRPEQEVVITRLSRDDTGHLRIDESDGDDEEGEEANGGSTNEETLQRSSVDADTQATDLVTNPQSSDNAEDADSAETHATIDSPDRMKASEVPAADEDVETTRVDEGSAPIWSTVSGQVFMSTNGHLRSDNVTDQTGMQTFKYTVQWDESKASDLQIEKPGLHARILQAVDELSVQGVQYAMLCADHLVDILPQNPAVTMTFYGVDESSSKLSTSNLANHRHYSLVIRSASRGSETGKPIINIMLPVMRFRYTKDKDPAGSYRNIRIQLEASGLANTVTAGTRLLDVLKGVYQTIKDGLLPALQAEGETLPIDKLVRLSARFVASSDVIKNSLSLTGVRVWSRTYRGPETGWRASVVVNVPEDLADRANGRDVFLALGSNVGDRFGAIESACKIIDDSGSMKIRETSPLYETEPMYVEDQERFLNGVCRIVTNLRPIELLDQLQAIESGLGRVKLIDKGPRNIDLDILAYKGEAFSSRRLIIPHKLMREREFVLRPLCDTSGKDYIHPSSNLSASAHLAELRPSASPMYPLTPLSPHLSIRALDPCRRTQIMSILNLTPDSFSDGGIHSPSNLRTTILTHISQGATILDLGGQSSRPNAPSITAEEELNRILPALEIIKSLPEAANIAISIDTYRADVAREAIKAGAHIINDISAGTLDEAMLPTIAELGCTYIMMHMRGDPSTMQSPPHTTYPDGQLLKIIRDELLLRLKAAQDAGIRRWRIILDPGIGFAKTKEQNLEILRRFGELRNMEGLSTYSWLVGSSRKGFVGEVTGVKEARERVHGTGVTVTAAVAGGAEIVRVHDVEEMRQVVRMAEAVYRGI